MQTIALLVLLTTAILCSSLDPRRCSSSPAATRDGLVGVAVTTVGKHIDYTESTPRWSGIVDGLCPPSVPPTADCSAFVTWLYWTTFGKYPDYLNNENWSAGYTGSMESSPYGVERSLDAALPGDIVLYGRPTISHVALYIGNSEVIEFGETGPVRHLSIDYRSDRNRLMAFPSFFAVGSSCTFAGQSGKCIDTQQDKCPGSVAAGHCAGPSYVQCCV